MERFDLKCPQCGANLTLDDSETKIFCEYCGFTSLIMKKETVAEAARRVEALTYAGERGSQRAKLEIEKEKSRRKAAKRIVAILVFIAVGFLAYFIHRLTLPKGNPFEYIELSFTGITGKGRVEFKKTYSKDPSNKLDPNLIDYKITPQDNLSEGDKVTVFASSKNFRLEPQESIYKVEGLDLYLDDLSLLPEESIESIHALAKEKLDLNFEYAKNNIDELSYEPVAMYLITNKKSENLLYDVHKVHAAVNEEQVESSFYAVIYFKDIVIRGGDYSAFNYDRNMYTGETIKVFDTAYWSPFVTGFHSLDAVKADIISQKSAGMEFQER